MDKKLKKLQQKLNVEFKDINLLKDAITHKSFNKNINYEKLEFLGDRVLGLVISIKLIELYPNEKEGGLDKKLASLVNKSTCFEIGKKLELNKYVYIDNIKHKDTIESKIISDCTEAIIGAVFLEKGFIYTNKYILNLWKDFLDKSDFTFIDAKTKLQEYSLKKFKLLPIYKTISSDGPKHKPLFTVAVKLKNSNYVNGTGSSKKTAEQNAAKKFMDIKNI